MVQPTYTITQLRDMILDRDQRGFNYLYDAYSAALFGEIVRMVPDRQVAEILLIEIMLYIFKHFDSYDPNKSMLSTWMIVLTKKMVASFQHKDAKKTISFNMGLPQPDLIRLTF